MAYSDDEIIGGASPTVSDSDSGADSAVEQSKKRKLTKGSKSTAKKQKTSSNLIADSDEEEDTKEKKKSSFIEDEASESEDGGNGGDDSDEEEDDDDGEDKNEYEKDGFIVDDEIDEDEDSDDEARHRRRRKRKEKKLKRLKQKTEAVDDEDLMLVRENLGIDTGLGRSDSEDEDDEIDRPSKSKKGDNLMSRELSYRMFGDSDDEEEDTAPRRMDNFIGDDEYASDDMDEFIVDDDEEGREVPRRRRKQAPSQSAMMQGPSVYQMDEAEELFGDVNDFLKVARGTEILSEGSKKSKKAAFLEKFEPSVLKEHMMTDDLASIRDKDLPERYQYIFAKRTFPDAEDRAVESEWISDSIIKSIEKGQRKVGSRGEIVAAIDNVLRFYHDEKMEPAFVQRYCKEYWKPAGLRSRNLYEILDLDLKWEKLNRKRRSFQSGLQRVVDASNAKESTFVRECYEKLISFPDEKTFQDFSDFLALDAPDKGASSERQFRRPGRRNFYQICTKGGLRPLSNAFTMNATVLGGLVAGISHEDVLRLVPTPDESPGTLAEQYTSKEFPSTEDVLKGARHIAASKAAAEPNVRKCIRELYRQNAKIFTEATAKGREDIDEFHYCHGLQYLDGMPVLEVFEGGDLFLRLTKAQKEGLITISVINELAQDLIDPLEQFYLSPSASEVEEEWQTQRHYVLQEAISAFLVPLFENEVQRDLLVRSRDVVLKQCGEAMKKRLMVRPFEPSDGGDAHIVSIWVENGMDAIAHIVALDENGEMVDKTQGYCKRQEKDVQKLTNTLFKFLQEHSQTHAVVINLSAGMKCMDMGELVDAVRRQLGRDVASRFGNDDGTDYFDICFLKDDVPLMYSRSKRAEQEYPEESESFRAAIALGRYLKNPASELCAMWGSVPFNDPSRGHELLFLNLHPLQHSLVKDAILKEYDRIFLQVVNKFGVDINLLANHKHTSYQLQFICGLGPVKASYVLDKVRAKSIIERRQELLSKGFVSKVVYRNCAGFIRIRERDALKDSPLNPLDDTRIHPESYYMAVKMCGDANNNSTIDMYDPNQYSYAVEDTMFQSASAIKARNAPLNARLDDAEIQDALAELDLPAYAARLELQKKGPKLLTLEYIKRELRYPYFDKREKYQVPKDEELFFLLNGETKDTLRVGMIVPCTLVNPTGDFVRVRLQNGVRSSLRRENLPDYMTKDWLRINGFPKGLTVNAKILSFKQDNFNRYEAILGCDSRSLTDVAMCFNPHLFPEYTRTQSVINDSVARIDKLVNQLVIEENDEGYDQEIRRPTQPKRKKRQIAHPLFRNINCKAAMDYLREQPIGDVIIRPSAKGTDHLTLTWKMLDGVYRHFEIEEREKPSDTRIGAKLVIKDQVYENIDELIARFVDPMNEFVDEVIRYKYYKSVSQEEVREELIKQKKSNPSSIPYALHVYNKFPGCFSITFIARVTPHSCHMEVKPNGYRFFGRIESSTLPTLREALQFFKMKALVAPQTSSSTRDSSYSSTSLKRDSSAPFSSESSSRGRDQSYSNGSSYDSGRSDSRYSHQGSHPDSRYDSRRDDRYGGPSRGDNRYHGQGSRYRNDLPVGGGGRRW